MCVVNIKTPKQNNTSIGVLLYANRWYCYIKRFFQDWFLNSRLLIVGLLLLTQQLLLPPISMCIRYVESSVNAALVT